MIDLDFLQSLIRAMDESSLDSIEIERGGTRVRLAKTPPAAPVSPTAPAAAPAPVAAPPPHPSPGGGEPGATVEGSTPPAEEPEAQGSPVESPMVGTFYRAPAPDAPPYVEVGQRVSKGDTLCIIEAMKLMNELEAEISGTITEILVENAEPVEYGQVLFRIDPT
jgi:acetyl-CoA carboxylase biotin carboxyl carrier protein